MRWAGCCQLRDKKEDSEIQISACVSTLRVTLELSLGIINLSGPRGRGSGIQRAQAAPSLFPASFIRDKEERSLCISLSLGCHTQEGGRFLKSPISCSFQPCSKSSRGSKGAAVPPRKEGKGNEGWSWEERDNPQWEQLLCLPHLGVQRFQQQLVTKCFATVWGGGLNFQGV